MSQEIVNIGTDPSNVVRSEKAHSVEAPIIAMEGCVPPKRKIPFFIPAQSRHGISYEFNPEMLETGVEIVSTSYLIPPETIDPGHI